MKENLNKLKKKAGTGEVGFLFTALFFAMLALFTAVGIVHGLIRGVLENADIIEYICELVISLFITVSAGLLALCFNRIRINGDPFNAKNVRLIKFSSAFMCIGGIIGAAISVWSNHAYPDDALLNRGTSAGICCGILICGAVIGSFIDLFSYATEVQNELDEIA